MLRHPNFQQPYRFRAGPADETDDDASSYHPAYQRTPFPGAVPLSQTTGSVIDDDDDEYEDEDAIPPHLMPGQRPRSYSMPPGMSPYPMGGPMGGPAFGTPDQGPGLILPSPDRDRGPYQPPQPHVKPAKSALRQSNRSTMDAFGGMGAPMSGAMSAFGSPPNTGPPPYGPGTFPPNHFPQAVPGAPTTPGGQYFPQQLPGQPPVNPYAYQAGHPGVPMQAQHPFVTMPRQKGPTTLRNPMNPMNPQMQPRMAMPTPMMGMGMPPSAPMPTPMPTPMGMPQSTSMPPMTIPMTDTGFPSAQSHRSHRSNKRRHRRDEDESSSTSDGVIPNGYINTMQPTVNMPAPMYLPNANANASTSAAAIAAANASANPLPQPPRAIPVPTIPTMAPEDSSRAGSPHGHFRKSPSPPPKPPPNPLPTPPKSVIHDSRMAKELEDAQEEVKRAKEHTERMRDKAIARIEADTWRSFGVPIGGDEENPMVPLIPGVTAPGALSNVTNTVDTNKPTNATTSHNRKTSNAAKITTTSNIKRRKKEKDGDSEEGDAEDSSPKESHGHGTLAAGFGSILKRMSTKARPNQDSNKPPIPPKPSRPRRASASAAMTPRPPMMPHTNSGGVPAEEGLYPRGAKSAPHGPSGLNGINGRPYMLQRTPGGQQMPQFRDPRTGEYFDPRTGEYYDPQNGQWWDPRTRKYYVRPGTASGPHGPREIEEEEEAIVAKGSKGKGGWRSMIRKFTTGTAPDHQPKPITAQLLFPPNPAISAGARGPKLAEHPQSYVYPQNFGSTRSSRSRTTSEGRRNTWDVPPLTGTTVGGRSTTNVAPAGHPSALKGHARGYSEAALTGYRQGPGQGPGPHSQMPSGNIYFSTKSAPYGEFRLDSFHSISWGGETAPTAMHWFCSGEFEAYGCGLGATGLGTGWTRPSSMNSAPTSGAGRLLRGLLGKGDGAGAGGLGVLGGKAAKDARAEYARARTKESQHILTQRTPRDVDQTLTMVRMSSRPRADWEAVRRLKLEEILYLKFQQHRDLRTLLLETDTSALIFDSDDVLLGNGGPHGQGGANELGLALMRVRDRIWRQLRGED